MDGGGDLFVLTWSHLLRLVVFIGFSILLALIAFVRNGPSDRMFSLMTVVWSAVNSLVVYLLMQHIWAPPPHFAQVVLEHIQFWMIVNVELDLLYGWIGGSMLIWAPFSRKYTNLWQGFGRAIVLQATGLFCLDVFFTALLLR